MLFYILLRFWGLLPPGPYQNFAPGPRWELPYPRTLSPAVYHVNPFWVRSGVYLVYDGFNN